jgi:predicted nucleic acid-binding protein
MIVADASLLANYLNPAALNAEADAVYTKDIVWYATPLWRSELRNTLLKYIRAGRMASSLAETILKDAAELLGNREQSVTDAQVLAAAMAFKLSAYDAEYVALAQRIRAPLVTFDRRLTLAAPGIAFLPADYVSRY